MNTLHIRICSAEQAFAEFQQLARRIDAGETVSTAEPTLSLSSIESFYSLMTQRRVELLQILRGTGPTSIRALSKVLGRDYKNVHTDVVTLIEAGLIERNDAGEISTPWDKFELQVELRPQAA